MYVYFPCLHEAHSVLSTYLMGQRHEKGFWPTQTTHIHKPSIMRFHGQVCCANVCGCVCVCVQNIVLKVMVYGAAKRRRGAGRALGPNGFLVEMNARYFMRRRRRRLYGDPPSSVSFSQHFPAGLIAFSSLGAREQIGMICSLLCWWFMLCFVTTSPISGITNTYKLITYKTVHSILRCIDPLKILWNNIKRRLAVNWIQVFNDICLARI